MKMISKILYFHETRDYPGNVFVKRIRDGKIAKLLFFRGESAYKNAECMFEIIPEDDDNECSHENKKSFICTDCGAEIEP